MPRYTNTGSTQVVVGSIRIEPGQTVDSRIWLTTPLPAGITKLADAPIFDVVVLSQKITATDTVAVPASLETNYKVSVYCTAGDVTVQTDTAASTGRILGTGMVWEALCLQRTINSLIFTVSGGTAYLTIERI